MTSLTVELSRIVAQAFAAEGLPERFGQVQVSDRPDLAAFPHTTPAHIGYEIQIIDDDREKFPSGSIYTFVPAKTGINMPMLPIIATVCSHQGIALKIKWCVPIRV